MILQVIILVEITFEINVNLLHAFDGIYVIGFCKLWQEMQIGK